MPKWNIAIQTEELFDPDIRPNSPEKRHFSASFLFQNSQIVLVIFQLTHEVNLSFRINFLSTFKIINWLINFRY